jgi:uncharacterized protein involved in exopolysaccharide biosynthesis
VDRGADGLIHRSATQARERFMSGFWAYLWKRRLRLVGIWLVIMILVLIRLMTMREVFTSTCLMMPLSLEQVRQGVDGRLGGSSVRSLIVGGGDSDAYAAAAFLDSDVLMTEVINDLHLDRELFYKAWDPKTEKWKKEAPHPGKARKAFARRYDVTYDGFTGLLELQVHWWSATRAQEIAAAMVETADGMLREAAIEDGERRVEELKREMDNVTVADIGSFLAEEITSAVSSLASIRARTGYAFRVIDPPHAPYKKSWPPRLLILILVGAAVAGVEVGVVAGIHARARG